MDTEKQLSEWVQRALDHAQMKQAELSRALIQSGLSTIDRSAVNKVVLGTRKLSAEEMLEVSRITDYPIPDRRKGKSKADEKRTILTLQKKLEDALELLQRYLG